MTVANSASLYVVALTLRGVNSNEVVAGPTKRFMGNLEKFLFLNHGFLAKNGNLSYS